MDAPLYEHAASSGPVQGPLADNFIVVAFALASNFGIEVAKDNTLLILPASVGYLLV